VRIVRHSGPQGLRMALKLVDIKGVTSFITNGELVHMLAAAETAPDGLECFFRMVMPVLPTACRPPEMRNEWVAHPTTHLYRAVLRMNAVADRGPDESAALQNAVNVLFDTSNTRHVSYSASADTGGFRQRLDGKGGRLRLNMLGKRTDFSARTVLSGDPTLHINEIGVPRSICNTLTVPERVTIHNIQKSLCGVKYIVKPGGERYDCAIFTGPICVGDQVERSLRDGDVVLVNRQPTLHRGSMVACRVRVRPSKTFSLNYSTMVPMNADTDGDEINIHVPQSLDARAELETCMMASTNIVSSQSSKPLMGCTQDSLLGCYLLSRNELVPRSTFCDILYDAGVGLDFSSPTQFFFPGRQAMTYVLEHLGLRQITHSVPKSGFVCVASHIQSGVFDKSVVGNADKSMVHVVFLTYGHIAAANFICTMQRVASSYLARFGFSIGIGDCLVGIRHDIGHLKLTEYMHAEAVRTGKLPIESEVLEALNPMNRMTDALYGTRNNNLVDIISAGSKGTMVNFNQITQAVGQQIVDAGRIGDYNFGRALPHFSRFDSGLAARGFIPNSFIQGLSPQEVFMHAMSGRIGIIDTSCKTADTGAQSRRLVKCLESLIVADGGEGRRPVIDRINGNVVQFEYGDDALDGTYLM
jgi:DNA-directed RNA polymerase II subunit RPB1